MSVVHLYPFEPRGRHGGTMRLLAAIAGTGRVAMPEIHYFDPGAGRWHGPLDPAAIDDLVAQRPVVPSPIDARSRRSLKRRAFPSTLWESGRAARRALGDHLDRARLDRGTGLLVHTTYLAPALASLPVRPEPTVLDVYDLVWRAHRNDARAGSPPLAAVRSAYAASVRLRELGALRAADRVLVAGHDDAAALQSAGVGAEWVPTATPVDPVPPRTPDGTLRVGLLGNFAHISTRRGAEELLSSPLAADRDVRVVVAGLGSEAAVAWRPTEAAASPSVEILGPVERAEDFYAAIDCVVAPVLGGSGIKVKIGETLLAGRPVVTTELGAAGYPPKVRRHFAQCAPARLDRDAVLSAIEAFDLAAARADAEAEQGWEAVVARYAAALGS